MDFKYYTFEELLPYVNKRVQYKGFGDDTLEDPLSLQQVGNRKVLTLPFCGGVIATTVKIKLEI